MCIPWERRYLIDPPDVLHTDETPLRVLAAQAALLPPNTKPDTEFGTESHVLLSLRALPCFV